MVTVYGCGAVISCPNRTVAPPPVGQVIAIGDAGVVGAGADDVVGVATVDGPTDVLASPPFCACARGPPRWPRNTLPTRAPANAIAPIRTPIRWFRLRRAARACSPSSAEDRGERRDGPPEAGRERGARAPWLDR